MLTPTSPKPWWKRWWGISLLVFAALMVVGAIGALAGLSEKDDSPTSDGAAVAAGYVALCNDGNYSNNDDFDATCSGGDDVDYWLGDFGECSNGRAIRLAPGQSCDDMGGFRTVLPSSFVPAPMDNDIALCANGMYSDNSDFGAACNSNGGVQSWLAPFAECRNGEIVPLSADHKCDSGVARLLDTDPNPPSTTIPATTTVQTTPATAPETSAATTTVAPETTAAPTTTSSTTTSSSTTTELVLSIDDIREFVFPLTFDSNRDLVVELLSADFVVRTVDLYDYDVATGTVRVSITPNFDYDGGVRDDAWTIMRAMSEFWAEDGLWFLDNPRWSPALDVSITTAQYRCSGDQMQLIQQARFSRSDWESQCRVR